MSVFELALIVTLLVLTVSLFILGVFLYHALAKLQASFAKLAYLTRQDTKKYFDDAATQAVAIAESTLLKSQSAIEETVQVALQKAAQEMQEVVKRSEKEASAAIERAREEGDLIRQQSHQEGERIRLAAVEHAVAAIQSAAQEWAGQHLSPQDQSDIIEQLVDNYLREHKSVHA